MPHYKLFITYPMKNFVKKDPGYVTSLAATRNIYSKQDFCCKENFLS